MKKFAAPVAKCKNKQHVQNSNFSPADGVNRSDEPLVEDKTLLSLNSAEMEDSK